MSTEPKQVVREYLECWNDSEPGRLADVMTDDVHVTGLPGGMETDGIEAYQEFTEATLSAFPDLHWTVEDSIAEGNRVAALVTATGTHEGEFVGIPATGRDIEMEGTLYFRVADGKITRKWNRVDELGMLQQIGLLPEDLSAMAAAADD